MRLPTSSSFVKAATASLALQSSAAFASPVAGSNSPEVGAISPANSARDITSYSSVSSAHSGNDIAVLAAVSARNVPMQQLAGHEPAIRPGSGGRRPLPRHNHGTDRDTKKMRHDDRNEENTNEVTWKPLDPIVQLGDLQLTAREDETHDTGTTMLSARQVPNPPALPVPVSQYGGSVPISSGQVVSGINQEGPLYVPQAVGALIPNGIPIAPQIPNGIPQPQAPGGNIFGQPLGIVSSQFPNLGPQIPQIPGVSSLEASNNENVPAPFSPVEQIPGALQQASNPAGIIVGAAGPAIGGTPISGALNTGTGVIQNGPFNAVGSTVNGIPIVGGVAPGVVQGLPNPQGIAGVLPGANGLAGTIQGVIPVSTVQGAIGGPLSTIQGAAGNPLSIVQGTIGNTPVGGVLENGFATQGGSAQSADSPAGDATNNMVNVLQSGDNPLDLKDGGGNTGLDSPSSTVATPPTSPDTTNTIGSPEATSTSGSPEYTTSTASGSPVFTIGSNSSEITSTVTSATAEASGTALSMGQYQVGILPEHVAPSSLFLSPFVSVPTNTPVSPWDVPDTVTSVVGSMQSSLPVSAPVAAPSAPSAPSAPDPPVFIRAPRGDRMARGAHTDEPLPDGFPAPSAPIPGDKPPLLTTKQESTKDGVQYDDPMSSSALQPSATSSYISGSGMNCTETEDSSKIAPTPSKINSRRRRFFRFYRKENA